MLRLSQWRVPAPPFGFWKSAGYILGAIQRFVFGCKSMGKLGKAIKTGLMVGASGLALYSIARRLKLTNRIARALQDVEAVPFPGTRLYAFLAAKQLRPLYQEICREILEEKKFKRVLNLNTGPGYLPIELALQDNSIEVTGTDPSPDMVQIARANARAEDINEQIHFAIGDSSNLPFPGRYFDLVISVNVLHHWKNPVQVFEEAYRVLTPDGEFWVYDYRKDVPAEQFQALAKDLPFYLRAQFQLGPFASWQAAYDKEEMCRIASHAHFSDPVIEDCVLPLFGKPMPIFVRLRIRKSGHKDDEH